MNSDFDRSLDTVAALLRLLGDHAFDTEEHSAEQTRTSAEAWARHILLRTDHPEHPTGRPSEVRDFVGARRFVENLRRSEQRFVGKALSDFRQMVWSVVQNVHRALAVDGDEDAAARSELLRLKAALDGNSIAQLREEAALVASRLSQMISARERRRSEQLEVLGTELKSLHHRLEEARRSSETCSLTGLYNRRAFDGYLERVVEFDGLTGVPVTLLLMDVDDFKRINDTYGHPVGDDALRGLGRELSRVFLRKCDFVARYGGEEFAVVMRDTTERDARALADRLRERLSQVRISGHPEIVLTVSIGVSALRGADDVTSLLVRTDMALLKAKRDGKNRAIVAD
jgi:diguanylate cyclase